jgi:serine/threonine-protein kinase
MEPIPTGTVIGGRYRVVAAIGDGAMGAVYRVEDSENRENYALKLLHADLSRHPQIIARFEREAIAASRIDHPNVVHATDFGCTAEGSFYLVLELVEGRDLRSELQSGPMDAARAINVVRGVVAGVRAAHEKGIIHRDLKPENIMLVEHEDNRDFVKLLDFGIARLESGNNNPQRSMQALTIAGTPLGTPEYMSPEQVLGKPVDCRTDLYAIGVIMFELLAGTCPFEGKVAKLLQQHLAAQPPELPPAVAAGHPDLARIVRILLAKEPKNRFQSAAELAEALSASAAGNARPARAPAPSRAESRTLASLAMRASLAKKRLVGIVAPPARRSARRTVSIAVACCAALLLAALLFVIKRDRATPASDEPADPSDAASVDPRRADSPVQTSATGEGGKGTPAKSRRKPSEGAAPVKTKTK